MPNRILSGSLATSDSLSRVSIEAEVAFLHLVSVADDYGRFDGRPAVLLAALFPTRMETVSIEALSRWLRELEVEGLIRWYVVDGRRYVTLPGWKKYQRDPRAQRSKYPEPPAADTAPAAPAGPQPEPADNPLSDDRELRSDVSESLTDAPVLSDSDSDSEVVSEGEKEKEPPASPALALLPPPSAPKRTRKSSPKVLMPDRLEPEQVERLKRLVADLHLSDHQLRYACRYVRNWSHANDKKANDWIRAMENYLRDGWALKGYRAPSGAHVAASSPGWDLPKEAAS